MGRRITIWAGMLLAVLASFLSRDIDSDAAAFKAPYIIEQAQGKAPMVKAFLTGNKMRDSASFAGTLGENIQLSQDGKSTVFEKSGEGVHYIILVDNSGSIEKKQFAEVKKQLAKMRRSMSDKDSMTLYTVGTTSPSGEKKNVLGRTVQGEDPKKLQGDVGKINKIRYISGKNSRTILYRSLNQVLVANPSPVKRTIVLVVTDGEDDSDGKDNSKSSTVKQVKQAAIPVYGVLLKNKSGRPDKDKMRCTADQILAEENCRGYYADCRSGAVSKVKKAFSDLRDIWQKKTYVVRLKAPNNKKLDGAVKLALTAYTGDSTTTLAPVAMDYSSFESDTEAPVISEIKKSSSNGITFMIRDDAGDVVGADQKDNYVVRTKEGSGKGKVWQIRNVNYNSIDNTVVLTFEEDLYTGEYVLTCNNIHSFIR